MKHISTYLTKYNHITMNTKISQLGKSMEVKKRNDDTEFTCFTDEAPEDLKSLFLEHYKVKDLDYQIFSKAIDTYLEAWENNEDSPTLLIDYIEENYNDFSSVYTTDRLSYLDIFNQSEITEFVQSYKVDIADACAMWYDEQVKGAISIIHEWVINSEVK